MFETCNYNYTASTSAQIASSSCAIATSSPELIASSSDIAIIPTMDAGQVLIAFLLFCILLLQLTMHVLGALDRIRTRKTHLGYSGGDVEIREDI